MTISFLENANQAQLSTSPVARIKVIGVGGCGGNAVNHMIEAGVAGVEFIAANTDAQDLKRNKAVQLLQLGAALTKGLGAGAKPEVGRAAAEEDRQRITELMDGADMVFITAGMGGGTGTGAAPVFAQIAKEKKILTVGVVTRPFEFEGKRQKAAQEGIDELQKYVDSLIVIPNDRLMKVLGQDVTVRDAFRAADDVLKGAVMGIAEVINVPGIVNVDFADVRTVMESMGMAMMGSAYAEGADRAHKAAEAAIASPLLEDISLEGARGVLVNITASSDTLKMKEIQEAINLIKQHAAEDANIIYGSAYDDSLGDCLRVTLVATGLGLPPPTRQASLHIVTRTGTDHALGHTGSEPAEVSSSALRTERPSVFHSPRNRTHGALESSRGTRFTGEDRTIPTYLRTDADIPSFLRKQAD